MKQINRSDFFRTLLGGLAGVIAAPLLKAEPKPVNIETVITEPAFVGHNTTDGWSTISNARNGYNDHFYFDQDTMASRWTTTVTNDCEATETMNFTIVNSAGDEMPLIEATQWTMAEPAKYIDPKIAQIITERN